MSRAVSLRDASSAASCRSDASSSRPAISRTLGGKPCERCVRPASFKRHRHSLTGRGYRRWQHVFRRPSPLEPHPRTPPACRPLCLCWVGQGTPCSAVSLLSPSHSLACLRTTQLNRATFLGRAENTGASVRVLLLDSLLRKARAIFVGVLFILAALPYFSSEVHVAFG